MLDTTRCCSGMQVSTPMGHQNSLPRPVARIQTKACVVCIYLCAHIDHNSVSLFFLSNKRYSSPHKPLVHSMVLAHLLRRLRALGNRTGNKSEDKEIYANNHGCLNNSEHDELCWICMEGATLDSPLFQRCACPRVVHDKCMARWQLQSAGKEYETNHV